MKVNTEGEQGGCEAGLARQKGNPRADLLMETKVKADANENSYLNSGEKEAMEDGFHEERSLTRKWCFRRQVWWTQEHRAI